MSTIVNRLIATAKDEIGYLEKETNEQLDDKTANAGDKNFTKYARDLDKISNFYNGRKNGHPWCDAFVDWCFVKTFGIENARYLLCQPEKSLGAGCKYSLMYYKENGQFYYSSPKIGDQIFFESELGEVIHTGLVYKVTSAYVYTIEGNTSSLPGVVANGGMVRDKKYPLGASYIAGYGRPNYAHIKSSYQPTVLEWQEAAIKDSFKFPKYGADGKWGDECKEVACKAIVKKRKLRYKYKNLTKLVQRVINVTDDGKCGKETKKAIIAYQIANNLTSDGKVGLETWEHMLNV